MNKQRYQKPKYKAENKNIKATMVKAGILIMYRFSI